MFYRFNITRSRTSKIDPTFCFFSPENFFVRNFRMRVTFVENVTFWHKDFIAITGYFLQDCEFRRYFPLRCTYFEKVRSSGQRFSKSSSDPIEDLDNSLVLVLTGISKGSIVTQTLKQYVPPTWISVPTKAIVLPLFTRLSLTMLSSPSSSALIYLK